MYPTRRRLGFSTAFTLIELLVVIAIIAILAVVVVLTLNPAQLLAQSRDANRVSDMATLQSAIGLYQTDTGGSGNMGSSTVVYVSLADTTSTCVNLGLPALPAGSIYDCPTSTSSRLVNNQGWVPLNFSLISSGAPFGSLPIDPINTSSSGLYYSYVASGTSYMVSAIPESQKQKASLGQRPSVPGYPDIIANGSSLTINPLYNSNGLVGYWPMDEGVGSTTQDLTGNNNLGTWTGTPVGTNSTYYTAGKVGSYAGSFNGSGTNILNIPTLSVNASAFTFSTWIAPGTNMSYTQFLTVGTVSGINFRMFAGPATGGMYLTATGYQSVISGIVAPFNAWSLITFTFDGGPAKVYVNGVLANTVAWAWSGQSVGVMMGGGYGYGGLLDDVRIYNRALSAAEILALYNAEK